VAATLIDWLVGSGIPMTDMIASNIERAPDWQLLAEFAVKSLSGSKQILTDRVAETVQCLSLKPAQLERIHEIMTQALNRARRSAQLAEHLYPMHIRIWSPETYVDGFGWGFFIVEKQRIEPQLTTGEAAYVVELYLYQEHHS
jgi:hypothetical protein